MFPLFSFFFFFVSSVRGSGEDVTSNSTLENERLAYFIYSPSLVQYRNINLHVHIRRSCGRENYTVIKIRANAFGELVIYPALQSPRWTNALIANVYVLIRWRCSQSHAAWLRLPGFMTKNNDWRRYRGETFLLHIGSSRQTPISSPMGLPRDTVRSRGWFKVAKHSFFLWLTAFAMQREV